MRASVGFALALALSAPPALAGSCDDAARTVREANELRRRGAHEAALARLVGLYRGCHAPRVLAQIGLTEHGRGRWLEAWRALHDALRRRDDLWVQANAAALGAAAAEARERLADVAPRASADGAQLAVDGCALGALPLATPYVVAPGRHVLRLTAPGHEALEVVVVLRAGERYRAFVALLMSAPW